MRRLLLTFTLFIVISTIKTIPVSAAPLPPPPSACCNSGFSFTAGTCLSDTIIGACGSAASNACGIAGLVPGVCNTSNIAQACIIAAVSGSFVTGNSHDICQGIIVSVIGAGWALVPGPIQNAVISACQGALSSVVGAGPILITSPLQCLSGQVCQAGVCTFSAPPGGPGGSLTGFCNGGQGFDTALGCIPFERNALITTLLNWAVGISGGIALILIVIASFLIVTSTGDPKRVQAGRELLTSALMGLVLIVLSVVLLNFIGVNVLGLSGLGFQL